MDLFDLLRIGFFLLIIVRPVMKAINKKGSKTKPKPVTRKNIGTVVRKKPSDEFNARLEEARRRVQQAMEGTESVEPQQQHSPSHTSSQHVGSERADELFHGTNTTKHLEMPDGFSQPVTMSKHQSLPQGIGGQLRVPKTLTGQTVVSHQNLPTGMSGQLSQANHQALSEDFTGHMSNKYNRPEFEVGIDKLEQHRSHHVKFKQHTSTSDDAFAQKTRKTVKLNNSIVKTDAQSIVNGIIWHQILSEPKYKKS